MQFRSNPLMSFLGTITLVWSGASVASPPAGSPPDDYVQKVEVTNQPTVDIGNTPDVNIANQPTVDIGNTPTVNVGTMPGVVVSNTSGNPVPVSLQSGLGTVAVENASGTKLSVEVDQGINNPVPVTNADAVYPHYPATLHASCGMNEDDDFQCAALVLDYQPGVTNPHRTLFVIESISYSCAWLSNSDNACSVRLETLLVDGTPGGDLLRPGNIDLPQASPFTSHGVTRVRDSMPFRAVVGATYSPGNEPAAFDALVLWARRSSDTGAYMDVDVYLYGYFVDQDSPDL